MIPAWAEFIAAWQGASTLDEVAAATGYTRDYCCTLASRLRRKGVDLKRFVQLSRFTPERSRAVGLANRNRHQFTPEKAAEASRMRWEYRAVELLCGGDR